MAKVVKGGWKKNPSAGQKLSAEGGGNEKVYLLKITLMGSRPEIWRRVLVPGDMTLAKLHKVIQTALWWTDSHLHEFIVGDTSYADPDPEMEMNESEDERKARLSQVAPRAGDSFFYVYDFGDYWEHKVTVEDILEGHETFAGRPVCLGGKQSGPPEDCGGIGGYHELRKILKNPKHPEHEDMKEWVGPYFDPDKFDLEETNRALKKIR